MNVLFVCNVRKDSNPFVSTLIDALRSLNVDCNASINEFWSNSKYYDIFHFQWPESIFGASFREKDIQILAKHLKYLKQSKKKIVITCHNLQPHRIKNRKQHYLYKQLYDLIYSYCDAFFHMGEYSYNLLYKEYPLSEHYILPHHIYDEIFKFDLDKRYCQEQLGLNQNKKNILCFGEFRSDEERNLIISLKKRADLADVDFITPGFYRYRLISKNPIRMLSRIYHYIKYRISGIKFTSHFLDDKMTEMYICACDIIMIQRLRILNSGNLPMGFYAGKVVVGPAVGNVGFILAKTGNPTFDPVNQDSIVKAIRAGIMLSDAEKGQKNREYIMRDCRTAVVAEKLKYYYFKLMKF